MRQRAGGGFEVSQVSQVALLLKEEALLHRSFSKTGFAVDLLVACRCSWNVDLVVAAINV